MRDMMSIVNRDCDHSVLLVDLSCVVAYFISFMTLQKEDILLFHSTSLSFILLFLLLGCYISRHL